MAGDYGSRTAAQLVWLAVAVALALTLVVGGGFLAWQGLSAGPAVTAAGQTAATASATGGRVAFGAPALVDGVPWRFPLTPDGAASAAATAVAVTGQGEVVFDPIRFAEVAEVVFTAEEAAAQIREVDAARVQFELSGWADQPESRRTYHFAPLAVRLEAFASDGQAATVEVWAMTLVGVGDQGGALFTTSTVELVADGDTWTVTALDSVEGPTPMVEAPPTAPGRTRALVRDALSTLPLPVGDGR
ncbi:hypothetical protein [Nitriliruptor alkaliphilus]|uniref:hypothetical protein n=1 Tax=Nitriliruptor alkaliphilus TaxID=427918 RepID=UPI000696A1CA|nr:hypothetical protein [Nitriliruptor alkaliphilus]